MHELGVLRHIVKTVSRLTEQHHIARVSYIELEVGEASGFVPQYLTRLFPVAADQCPALQGAELRLSAVPGRGLVIKEIGYGK
ncbi:MAG: hydrogenase maturation nickel metallochaperone HypA [Clostridia bacterium]|nr:hydrogenase maturation nickel metallochaperone HypA [Clostridia bacterium]